MKNGKKNKKTRDIGNQSPDSIDALLQVLEKLNQAHVDYVIIGGIACNLHGLIRATRDIDLLIPKNISNTKKILEVLAENLFWGLAKELDAEEVSKKPFTIIGDQPRVDLLTVAGQVKFDEAYKNSLRRKIQNVDVRYVDIDTLLKTKNTNRPTDYSDSVQLKAIKKMKKTDF
ncbi:MAG: hypothetical protein A3G32_07620 [Deltaproteobacteria bacterium RIFCSPLOWO2_12_FULL_40_28]|nr:MAG: hypothetical protein A3C45_03410 [Deltaproteobacteria bacterium RIFCSPHIGHO2_02_FULL_40_28]OGQ20285.1 MAG: hypothetical protein A3E27_06515 [Deltaproteobacteria bacterium RIFCSPHIGHO2_12_FULL_40_32]OGQ40396.1 MAG: hypothetical protein A3I69_07025 [Deltaproteobacteria bacterium RIFCSPLOWO2_02_FULL_40_36]OGQ54865.1 MAG: hypothetical protein A3G32_07620 [Deltaproteobacteria bacterium RIFCSPLOWO2_12_FULL_40_28]